MIVIDVRLRRWLFRIAGLSLFALTATRPAGASGCGTSLVGDIPLTIRDRLPIATLGANGHPVQLVIDTGAERTTFTPAVAERISAARPQVEFPRVMNGVTGRMPAREIELNTFNAGKLQIPWHRVLVAPISLGPIPFDGLLGVDALGDFDIDLDLRQARARLYHKQTCSNPGPSWSGRHSVLSTGRSRGDHLFFPVQLDGHQLVAFIDSGAQNSFLTKSAAVAVGLTPSMLSADRVITVHGVTGTVLAGYRHRFSELRIADLRLQSPELTVTDVKLEDGDLVLGMDFLMTHRVWLSYASRKIFLETK